MLEFKWALFSFLSREGEERLSEADKLNGLEWRGHLAFLCTTYRVNHSGQWSEWKEGGVFRFEFPGVDGMSVRKVKESWQVGDDKSTKLEPVSCSDVNPAPKSN
jgi:hypothetical protein